LALVPRDGDLDAEHAGQFPGPQHFLLRAIGHDPAPGHRQHAIDLRDHVGKVMGNADDAGAGSCARAGRATEAHPFNPNGSPGGLAGVTTADGRFTALMPHPERVVRNVQLSWSGADVSAPSPWMRMFHNARRWLA